MTERQLVQALESAREEVKRVQEQGDKGDKFHLVFMLQVVRDLEQKLEAK